MRLVRRRRQPATEGISIVEFLRSNLNPGKRGFDPTLKLPDEEPKVGELTWAPGALDGLIGRGRLAHEVARQDEEARPIYDALRAYAARPSEGNRRDLAVALASAKGTSADSLVDLLNANPIPNRSIAHAGVRQIVETASRRDQLKLSLVLLAHVGDSTDNGLLVLLGQHGEFTLFSVMAIEAVNRDPTPVLVDLAGATREWGRVAVIEGLLRHDSPVVRDYLLRHGFDDLGFLVGAEVALKVATQCRPLDAIQAAGEDAELIRGIGLVLYTLCMSPHGDLGDYGDARPATIEFMRRFEPAATSLVDYEVVLTIYKWLGLDRPGEGPSHLWPPADRELAAALAEAILNKPEWRAKVLAALDDPQERARGEHLARRFDIPVRSRLIDWLRDDPLNSMWWYSLCADQTAEEMDETLALAAELLDLDSIAIGPTESLGIGPEARRFNCVDFLLQALRGDPDEKSLEHKSGFPGKGESLLVASLRSPVTRNRNFALRTLEVWPRDLITPRLYEAIKAAANDPSESVRQRAIDLAKGLPKPIVN